MSTSTSTFDDLSRRAMMVIGVAALALGVATIVVVQPLVDSLPSSFAFVGLFGAVAFLLGLWMFRARYRGGIESTTVLDIEYPMSTPTPGHDIDRALYQLTELREGTIEYKEQIQKRLGEVAVAVISQRENCSREEAIQHLEEGTWTDDATAASFFSGGSPPRQSFVERKFGSGDTPYEQWVKAAVDEIVDLADMGSSEDPETTVAQTDDTGLLARLGLSSSTTVDPPSTRGTNYESSGAYDDAERVADGVLYANLVETGHWRGITAFALVAAGWGVITFTPAVLLISVVAIGFAAYARMGTAPDVTALEIDRHLSNDQPDPGEPVEVTVTVRNGGDAFLSDLRLIDAVPEPIRVVEGSPRLATALRPGSQATFTYTFVAERGSHEWPVQVVARDFSGSIEREALVQVDASIQCVPSLKTVSDMPVRSQTSLYSGQVDTAIGGSGLEFFAVREYREGDPMNRIDWKRHARTGELATIDFRLERAANVVLLFDGRDSAYVSPTPGDQHAVDRSVAAATEIFTALADRGDLVGLAAFDTVPCWLGPSAGDGHEERARRIFTSHPALSTIPPTQSETEGHYVDPMNHVRQQLSPGSQIMLFSPLCDDYTAEVARRLDSAGHLVTIISPNPTADRTVGQRLARVERTMRVNELRERGIRVVNWNYDATLGLELDRAEKRWAV
ncbi:DUF7269 family protein [Halomontanus rarus]|uniref:DUF7269 family protein n=1 Tax=Halomontanus rarus TaxID=3034020 RepID=UPI001A98A199